MNIASIWEEYAFAVIAAYYLLINIIAFILYAVDKSAAEKGKWRISENTLHLFSLIGGWPGALYARHRLRHKTIKQPFRVLFWCTAVVHCAAVVCLVIFA